MRKDVACALLGLQDKEIDEEKINSAYRAAIQMNHPDKYANDERLRKHAEDQCKLINEARRVLLCSVRNGEDCHADIDEEDREYAYGRATREEPWAEERNWSAGSSGAYSCPDQEGVYASVKPSFTPLLDIWRTSVAASVFGIGASFALIAAYKMPSDTAFSRVAFFVSFIVFVFTLLQFFYAVLVYPSFFGRSPKLTSRTLISFLNCLFGGIVFGPLWNGSLTNKRKGISHIVFSLIVGFYAATWLIGFGVAISIVALSY